MKYSTRAAGRIVFSAAFFIAFSRAFVVRADINWDGDNPLGNFTYCNNWYSDTCPGWGFGSGNLVFNYRNNSGQTSLYYDYGAWNNINDIIWETTFGAALPINGAGNGINFNQRVENRSAFAQTVNIPLSGAKNGATQIELNPVNSDLILSANIFNDNNKPFYSFGNNSKMLTVGVGLTGNSSVSFNIYAGGGTGNGKVKFTAAQTWGDGTHGITVGNGELWLDSGGSFLSGIPITVGLADANTAKFWLSANSGGISDGHTITVANSGGTKVLGGLNTSGTNTFTGSITLNGPVNLISDKSGGSVEFKTGVISGANSVTVNNGATSASTVILSGVNSYSGGTTLAAGQLNINYGTSSDTTHSAIGTGTLTISGGTIDNTSTADVTLGPTIAQNWNGDFTYVGSVHNLNLGTGAVTPSASRQVTVNGNNLIVGGVIGGGAVSLTKAGNGTLTLSGANSYTGKTIINGGTLSINGDGALGTAPGSVVADQITINGGTLASAASSFTLNANRGITLGASGGTLNYTGSGTLTYGGIIAGLVNTAGFTKSGSGSVTLTGVNTFGGGIGGDFTLTGGRVNFNNSSAAGGGKIIVTPASAVTIASTTSGTTLANNITLNVGGGQAIDLSAVGSSVSFILSGQLSGSAAITTGGSGSGKLTLSGKSTYSGSTTVSGGTLLINGGSTSDSSSGTGSGAISVSSGATLGGTGRIAGNVTFTTGALALFTNGATLNIGGTLTLNNNVVHLNLPANVGAGTYTLATYTASGSSGAFNSTPVVDSGSFASGTTYSITTAGGVVNLVVQNVTSTTLTRTAGNSPSLYGDSLTFHVVVSPNPGNGSTISFRTNGVEFANATTTSGAADVTTAALPYSSGSAYAVTAVFAGNGSYTSSSGTLSGGQQVNQRPLSITANNDTKTYGQTKTYGTGQTTFSSSGLQNSETIGSVTITAAGGTSATDGATAYSLTPSAATGGTFNAANYSITYNSGTLTVNPVAVSLSGTRIYDGTTNAPANILSIGNIIGADSVNVASGTGGLAAADAGSEALSSIGTLALGGTRATNYTLVGATGSVTITPLAATLAGTRAYDGTTNAASAILSVANAVGGDTVNVASGTGGLADKNVGTQSITSVGTLSLGNNSAGNYTLSGATGSVVITQAVTSVAVSSSANPSGYKDNISFTAALPSDATGSVVFKTNSAAISTNTLSAGTATSANTATLSRGTNSVTVEYAGDSNYLGSTNDLAGGQVVTNHQPAAATMLVQRSAGLTLKIALADIVTNWSDVDDDSVALSSLNLVTTNGVNLATNSTWILYTNSPNVNDQISYTVSDGQGGSTTGLINIAIVTTVTGTNSISSIVNNGTSVSLVAYGIPDVTYVTQRSTNLADWVSIATNVAATNGAISVTDNFTDLPAPPGSAYYRLSWTP